MIYLDYNATTPVDGSVLEKMLPYFSKYFGNASSNTHPWGWQAKDAVEKAREQLALAINVSPGEIIFTSGATEAANISITGTFRAYKSKKNEILINETEHKSVLETCRALEIEGAKIITIPVSREGIVDIDFIKDNISDKTALVCVMHANNETGAIQPVKEIGRLCAQTKSIFVCDATQSLGKITIDVKENNIGLLFISSHKIYGPKGAGALYISRKDPRVLPQPVLYGGSQENGIRPGTYNVPALVGFGYAAQLATEMQWEESARISRLRTILEQHLCELGQNYINGSIRNRLPNTTNILFKGKKASDLITKLPLLGMAFGSACTSAIPQPSHVLKAMGLTDEEVASSIRFSLGRGTTDSQIVEVIKMFKGLQ